MAIQPGAATSFVDALTTRGAVMLLVLSCSLSIAGLEVASAQSPSASTVVGYELRIYAPGINPANGTPGWRSSITISAVTCDRESAVVPPIVINPTMVSWSDPVHTGRVCIANLAQFLWSLPIDQGPYLATLTALAAQSQSSPSEPSNVFFRWARSGDPVGSAVPKP